MLIAANHPIPTVADHRATLIATDGSDPQHTPTVADRQATDGSDPHPMPTVADPQATDGSDPHHMSTAADPTTITSMSHSTQPSGMNYGMHTKTAFLCTHQYPTHYDVYIVLAIQSQKSTAHTI